MVYYYLDLETYGEAESPDPKRDEIICAIFCAIDAATGRQLQEPVLLKSWESSEEEIVRTLAGRMLDRPPFDFVPVGFAILYDLWFLKHKFNAYLDAGLDDRFYLDRPYVDLKQVMVFSRGKFKGVRLGPEGNPVQDWYKYGDYSSIERHTLLKLERFREEWKKHRAVMKKD